MKINKIKRYAFGLVIVMIMSVIFELALSNITNLNILLSKNKNFVLQDDMINLNNGLNEINLNTNNIQIQNIKVYYLNENSSQNIIKYTPVTIIYGTENDIRELNAKYMVGNRDVKININSEDSTLSLSLNIINEGDNIIIERIIANDTSIEFLFIRFILIFVLLAIIYLLKNTSIKEKIYDKNNKKHSINYYIIVTITVLIIIIALINLSNENTVYTETVVTYVRNFLNAQIESLINGKSEMLLEPSEELLNLPNPYDNTIRKSGIVDVCVDYSLYNGKFYSYFGLTPIFILMLPFKLITGYYLYNFYANIVFFIALFLALAKLYKMIVDRYVKKVSYFNFIFGFFVLIISSTLLFWLRGMVYDIETICATLMVVLSYILILSIYNNPSNKLLYLKITLCSITMGLIVLSKPSFICYYIVLFYLLINLKNILAKKNFWKCVRIFVFPIMILASIQMYWNYIRFNSIFEFGAMYQLTSIDMTNLTYFSPIKIFKACMQYLFTMPVVNINQFPFVFIKWYTHNMDLNTLIYESDVLGIFAVPISWIFIIYTTIKKNLKLDKELANTIKIFLISMIFILIVSARNGVGHVYIIDIKIFMYLFAIILYFKLLEKNDNSIYRKIFWIICIISILMTLPISITFGRDHLNSFDTNYEIYLKNIFEFWM